MGVRVGPIYRMKPKRIVQGLIRRVRRAWAYDDSRRRAKARNWLDASYGSGVIPYMVAINVTERCNLNCEYCCRRSVKLSESDMSLSDYKSLVKKCWWSREAPNVIGLGEPLVYPEIVDLLNWTNTRFPHCHVNMSTNGCVDFSSKRGLLEALLGCMHVQFSIDTVDPKILRKVRTGASLDMIEENMHHFIAAKSSSGRSHDMQPWVLINSVQTRETIHGMVDVIKFAESLPANSIKYVQFGTVQLEEYQDAHKPLIRYYGSDLECRRYVAEATEYAKRSKIKVIGLNKLLDQPTGWQQCRSIYDGLGIRPNGEIYMCCNKPDMSLGNIFTDDPLAAWNGPVARAFREQVLSDNPPDCCRACNFAFKGYYKKWIPQKPAR